MSSIVAPGKDFTLTFLHWRDILFSSMQDTMESPTMSVVFVMGLVFETDVLSTFILSY